MQICGYQLHNLELENNKNLGMFFCCVTEQVQGNVDPILEKKTYKQSIYCAPCICNNVSNLVHISFRSKHL